jgi:hypothetical protein
MAGGFKKLALVEVGILPPFGSSVGLSHGGLKPSLKNLENPRVGSIIFSKKWF